MPTLDKASFLKKLEDAHERERFRHNFEHALRERGLWRETLHETCENASQVTSISYTYFEQALHGYPVWSKMEKLSLALGITIEELFEKDLVSA